MNRRSLAAAALALTAAGSLVGCGEDAGSSSTNGSAFCKNDTVKVAYVGVLSGSSGAYGQGQYDGMKLAADKVNGAGGISAGPLEGCKIKIDKFDDKGDPSTGATIATKVAQDSSYLAYFGNVNSSVALAAAPILARSQMPMIVSYASSPDLTAAGYETVFRTSLDDNNLGADQARMLIDVLGRKKIAILWSNDAYGQGASAAFRQAAEGLGADIVLDESYDSGQTDYSVLATKLRQAAPDGIALMGVYSDNGLQLKQFASAGITAGPNLSILAAPGANTTELIKIGGQSATEGVHVQALWSDSAGGSAGQEFTTAYKDAFGSDPAEYAATAYDAMSFFADVASDGVDDRASLVEAMGQYRDESFPGITGKIQFDEHNQNTAAVSALLQVQGDKIVPVPAP